MKSMESRADLLEVRRQEGRQVAGKLYGPAIEGRKVTFPDLRLTRHQMRSLINTKLVSPICYLKKHSSFFENVEWLHCGFRRLKVPVLGALRRISLHKCDQGVRSTGEKDMMLFLGAKWARKSKSEVTLSSKCLVEKLWLLLCFVGKKINPQFFKIFSTAFIVLHTFQKKSSAFGPLPPQFPYMVTQERPAGKTSELHFLFSQPFLCPKTTSCP